MTARQPRTSRPVRRWAALLGLSAAVHGAVLAGFAFRRPPTSRIVALTVIGVSLAPRVPFARPTPSAPRPEAPPVRRPAVVLATTAPRHAASIDAATGEAGDAVDLFGPVFADGLWPRPVLVRQEPCDPDEPAQARDLCRREVLLIGLASDAAPGAKAQP
jgi:hypothetical protein